MFNTLFAATTLLSHTEPCGVFVTGTKLFSLIEYPCLEELVVSFSDIRYATCSYRSTQMSFSAVFFLTDNVDNQILKCHVQYLVMNRGVYVAKTLSAITVFSCLTFHYSCR